VTIIYLIYGLSKLADELTDLIGENNRLEIENGRLKTILNNKK